MYVITVRMDWQWALLIGVLIGVLVGGFLLVL